MLNFIKDVSKHIKNDQSFTGAAALAFYFSLAFFPGVLALVSLAAYLPFENVKQGIDLIINSSLPSDASIILVDTIKEVLDYKKPVMLSTGFLLACWSASSGVIAITEQLNKVLGTKEKRNYLTLRFHSLILFFTQLILVIFLIVSNILLNDYFASIIPLGTLAIQVLVSLILVLLSYACLYNFAPYPRSEFKFITPGSFISSILTIAFIWSFRIYLTYFNNFSTTYGSLAGMIIFMLWLYIVGFFIILGAQINKRLEDRMREKV